MFKVGDKVTRNPDFFTTHRWDEIVQSSNCDPNSVFEVDSIALGGIMTLREIKGGYVFDMKYFQVPKPMPTVIEYWEVAEEYDRSCTVMARFSSEVAAKEYHASKKNSHYVSVSSKKTITIFDSVQQLTQFTSEATKKRALEKLTKEERAVLGL